MRMTGTIRNDRLAAVKGAAGVVFGLTLLAGCGTGGGVAPDSSGSTADPSTKSCPDLRRSGTSTFESAGLTRSVSVLLPASPPPGLPVLFVWHGLGGDPDSMIPRMNLRALANRGVVVVLPVAWPDAEYGWGFTKDREDLTLFDDLRTCLARDLDVDLTRVVTSGFSAGGLWSTLLLMHHADALAGAVVMSGGLLPPIVTYTEPAWTLPVLLFDGGDQDIYRKGPVEVHFEETTARFAERLREDGHAATRCPSPPGHKMPAATWDLIHRFTLAARYGEARIEVGAVPSACSDAGAPTR